MTLTLPTREMLVGRRDEDWRFELLNLRGDVVSDLDGVTGGSLDFSIHNTIRSGGSLDYDGEPLDWNRHRIRVTYLLYGPDGDAFGWPFGTFIPGTTGRSYEDAGSSVTIDLYDRLLSLDRDQIVGPYTVAQNVRIDAATRTAALGGLGFPPRFTIDPTTETVRSTRVWEPGTTRLRIVNDLLDSINYFALEADGYGDFVSRHRTAAASRGIAWEFIDDDESIYSPDFVHERDGFDVPNRVSAHVEGDDAVAGFSAVATDEDPASEWSFQQRGEWISRQLESVEATSQPVLQSMVNRSLQDAQQVGSTFQIAHDVIPLKLNDAVRFVRSTEGIDVRGVVQSYSVRIGFQGDSEMQTTLREIVT